MKTGRPPVNSKLGKPTVLRLVFQAHESKRVERLRRQYGRSVTTKTFPEWCKLALLDEVDRRIFGAAQGCI
jgi:hypothetical protein